MNPLKKLCAIGAATAALLTISLGEAQAQTCNLVVRADAADGSGLQLYVERQDDKMVATSASWQGNKDTTWRVMWPGIGLSTYPSAPDRPLASYLAVSIPKGLKPKAETSSATIVVRIGEQSPWSTAYQGFNPAQTPSYDEYTLFVGEDQSSMDPTDIADPYANVRSVSVTVLTDTGEILAERIFKIPNRTDLDRLYKQAMVNAEAQKADIVDGGCVLAFPPAGS